MREPSASRRFRPKRRAPKKETRPITADPERQPKDSTKQKRLTQPAGEVEQTGVDRPEEEAEGKDDQGQADDEEKGANEGVEEAEDQGRDGQSAEGRARDAGHDTGGDEHSQRSRRPTQQENLRFHGLREDGVASRRASCRRSRNQVSWEGISAEGIGRGPDFARFAVATELEQGVGHRHPARSSGCRRPVGREAGPPARPALPRRGD